MSEKLNKLIQTINKKHGNDSVFLLGTSRNEKIPVIPTGILGLDSILGVGGLPKSRITEISGPEGSGKTGVALSTISQAQKMGQSVLFIDAEYALDIAFCKKLGVDVNNLAIAQPENLESAFTLIEDLLKDDPNAVDLIVIDSLDALESKREADSDLGDSNVGIKAKVCSQIFRRFASIIGKSSCCLVIINQVRDKLGVMGYGETTTTPGGRALKFYSSVRIDVRKVGLLKDGVVTGQKTRLYTVKNKVDAPYKEYEYEIDFTEGNTYVNEVFSLSVKNEIIKKAGAWFSYKELKAQGEDKMKDLLKANNLIQEIETILKEKLNLT